MTLNILALSLIVSPAAFATGLQSVVKCKSAGPTSTQIEFTVTKQAQYEGRTVTVRVDLAGQVMYDAKPYSLNISTANLPWPVGKFPVPQLPEEFSVSDGTVALAITSLASVLSSP